MDIFLVKPFEVEIGRMVRGRISADQNRVTGNVPWIISPTTFFILIIFLVYFAEKFLLQHLPLVGIEL